jgi:hypothetical protein
VSKRCKGLSCVLGEHGVNEWQDARNIVGVVVVVVVVALVDYEINWTGD